jgi:hypothetical protein
MTPSRRFLLLTLLTALTILPLRTACASQPLVVIVRPAADNRDVEEAIVRLRAELTAAGFDVALASSRADAEPREVVEQEHRERHPAATIGIFGADIWLVDQLTGKTVERTIEVGGAGGRRAPEVLAIRAAELLRASLMELLLAPTETAMPAARQPPPTHVRQWVMAALEPGQRPLRPGFDVGAVVLGSFRGVPLALAPVLRARLTLSENLIFRVSAAGLGTRPEIHSGTDAASIQQDVVVAEAQARFCMSRALHPLATIGAGAYRFGVEGHASWPHAPREAVRVHPAFELGGGVAVRLNPYLELNFETLALFAVPYPEVRFFGETAASAGRPTVLGSITLGGWL